MIAARQPLAIKEKITPSSVFGKIVVHNDVGERIGPWGGTECFLSKQTGVGPCLIVRSCRHKRHQGTFFKLTDVQKVLASYVTSGKLTVIVRHQRHTCTVMIDANHDDFPQLQYMAGLLQNQLRWHEMEVDVAVPSKKTRGGGRGGGEPTDAAVGVRDVEPEWERAGGDDTTGASQGGDVSDGEEDDPNVRIAKALGLAGNNSTPSGSTAPPAAPPSAGSKGGFTSEQLRAIALVRQGCSVFVTGSAGTGKSHWLRNLIDNVLPQNSDVVAVTAASGIAARAIKGQTVHSFAGIGLGDQPLEQLIQRVKSRPEVVRSWQSCRVWIIDEVGMLSAALFTVLDAVARDVTKRPTEPFGGIQMVLVGDFLQLPPIDQRGKGGVQYCFESPAWRTAELRSVRFTHDFRHTGDDAFARVCEDLRVGYVSVAAEDMLRERCAPKESNERHHSRDRGGDGSGMPPARIMSLRKQVDAYNDSQLSLIEDVHFYRYEAEDQTSVPGMELDQEVALARSLTLKLGALVIVVAAVPNTLLVNGDLGTVVRFQEQTRGPALPVVRTASGSEFPIPMIRMDVLGRGGVSLASRTQLPLQLAWALTVHRVQGMTLSAASVALDHSIFDQGQAYVAISRVRSHRNLFVTSLNFDVFQANAKVLQFLEHLFPKSPQEAAEELQRRERDAFTRATRMAKSSHGHQKGTKASRKRSRSPEAHPLEDGNERAIDQAKGDWEARARSVQSPGRRTPFTPSRAASTRSERGTQEAPPKALLLDDEA